MSERNTVRAAQVMLQLAWAADRRGAVLAFVLLGSQAFIGSLLAWWLKLLLDGLAAGSVRQLVLAAAGVVLSVAGAAVLSYAGQRVQLVLRERTRTLVDQRLIELVGGAPTLEIHETPEHLDHLQALQRESWQLGQCIPDLLEFFATVVRIATTTALLASVHPLLLLLPLFGLPALLLSSKTGGLFRLGNERAAAPARLAHHLYELATNQAAAKEMRLFRLGGEVARRFHQTQLEIQSIHRRVNAFGQLFGLVGRIAFLLGYFGAVLFVVGLAVDGRASVGDAALTAVLAGQVLGLITGSADLIQLGVRNLAMADRFRRLSEVSRRSRPAGSAAAPDRLRDGIRLQHVSYRYPLAPSDTVRDLSLRLPAGSTVAIVGDNGAGKTTLVKLLAGLHTPREGRVLIDGVDLASFDPYQWRLRVAAGFQDHARFELLLREAVGIGALDRLNDASAVVDALSRAGAADLLDAMPSGLATQLGPSWPGGIDLSGGQWQKVAIGRAMMRRTPLLLLLDEPTAALDADTEHRLFERWTAAARALRQRTGAVTVLVSHRFSTVRMADLIVVLRDGRIVETGSHDELVSRRGLYAELFELQARSYR